MAKGTRITVDLGSKELLRAVKFASVEQGKPTREIIIEALEQWLGGKKGSGQQDYLAMMKALDENRREEQLRQRSKIIFPINVAKRVKRVIG
jgi:hypothetical protein